MQGCEIQTTKLVWVFSSLVPGSWLAVSTPCQGNRPKLAVTVEHIVDGSGYTIAYPPSPRDPEFIICSLLLICFNIWSHMCKACLYVR